jgi:hypothetical protein
MQRRRHESGDEQHEAGRGDARRGGVGRAVRDDGREVERAAAAPPAGALARLASLARAALGVD